MSIHPIGQNYLKKSLLIIEEWFIQGCKSCNREISMLANEYLAAKSASIQPRTSGIDILNSWSNPSPPYGSSASKCYLALSAIYCLGRQNQISLVQAKCYHADVGRWRRYGACSEDRWTHEVGPNCGVQECDRQGKEGFETRTERGDQYLNEEKEDQAGCPLYGI